MPPIRPWASWESRRRKPQSSEQDAREHDDLGSVDSSGSTAAAFVSASGSEGSDAGDVSGDEVKGPSDDPVLVPGPVDEDFLQ